VTTAVSNEASASGSALAVASMIPSRSAEMAARVAARRLLGEALAAVAELRHDPVARVRAAAERATVILTAAGV
jgi:predicted regulator of Ras-like GTPase activity (Roadblock/LC7/MglB family)